MSAVLNAASAQYFTSQFLLNPDNGSLTLAMWVKPSSWNLSGTGTIRTLAQQEDGGGTGRTWLAARTGSSLGTQNVYSFLTLADLIGSTNLNANLNTWMLLGVSLTFGTVGVNANVWVNGASDGTNTGNPGGVTSGIMRFGAHKSPSATVDYWDGKLGPIGVWNIELPSSYWADLWNGGAGQPMYNVSTPSWYWPMLSDADPYFIDSGSHALTGVNSPTFDPYDHPFGALSASKLAVFGNHYRQQGMR